MPGTALLRDPDIPARGLLKATATLRVARFLICQLMRASSQRFQIKKPVSFADRLCARDWIRTSTTFRMLPPEDSASTNFATRAGGLKFEVRGLMLNSNLGVQI